MKIAILYGGKSGEHEVSLASAASVVRELKSEHKLTLIGISKAGTWILQPDSIAQDAKDGAEALDLRTNGPEVLIAPGEGFRVYGSHGASKLSVDLVFPVLHGTFGEDGTVQGLLECAALPYVGADVQGSALGMDKDTAKRLWQFHGLTVVPFLSVEATDDEGLLELRAEAEARFGWPMFVKPSRAGSSVGASRIVSAAAWLPALRDALRYDSKVLVEPFVEARELECSVLGNGVPRAFDPGEIVPSHEFYDYDAKYLDPNGAELLIPAPLETALKDELRSTAIKAYQILGLRGMARVDFFMDKKSGKLYLNELNTIPGFTSISMFPKMCEAGGLAYPELLDELIRLALERHYEKSALSYRRD
ncbi:MAG TPA: D-alanine--D-alanine ligase A [Spirochaetaceae bacterium]|jgi:D-alanine-D-alanine ligase|nr:D-alanine--D-alanine ligase A [Spirochaetaceae bacterium]